MSIRTRGAALLAALACVSLIVIGSVPKLWRILCSRLRPSPFPNPVAQPDDLPRIAPIGGAQVKTNTPLGLGPGTGRRWRRAVSVPMPPSHRHLPTARICRQRSPVRMLSCICRRSAI